MVREDIQDDLDFASVDVSFISLTKILGPAYNLLKTDAQMVCLIKPQFEAGKEKVGKKGVVREPSVHREVIEMVMDYAVSIGFEILHLDFSPIRGPEGNIEYLLHIYKASEPTEHERLPHEEYSQLIAQTVENAHKTLDI